MSTGESGTAQSGEALSLTLSAEQLSTLYPFHLVFDRAHRVVSAGPEARRVLPELVPGAELAGANLAGANLFDAAARGPNAQASYTSQRSGLSLQGPMVAVGDGNIAFLCAPVPAADDLESTLRATLDSTADGILLTSLDGEPLMYNKRFRELWHIPADWPEKPKPADLRALASEKLSDPEAAWQKFEWMNQHPGESSADVVYLRDGSVYERYTQPHLVDGKAVGRVWTCRDVTDRWRASQLLRESEASFRSIFENAPVGIYRTTPEGRIEMANPALIRMLGYDSFAELAAKNLEGPGFEPEYSRETFRERMAERGIIRGLEAEWKRRDGTSMFVRENAQAILDDSGAVRYYEGFVEDVTERRHFENLLRESELSYRRQFADNSAVMLLIDPDDSRIIDANAAALRFYGYQREQLLAMRISDLNLLPPDKLYLEMRSVPRIEGKRFEFRHRLADGSMRDVEVATSRIQSGGRTILHSIVFDITARKQAEEALRASEARFRSVIENVKEVIFQTDMQGLWTFLNPSWTEITGFTLEESLGTDFLGYVHPDDRQRNLDLFLPLIERKKDYCRHVIRYVCKDGSSRWIEVFARLTIDSEGAVVGTSGTLSDVTQRVEAAAELERARDAAQAADRAKSEFLANVSHEIRTPLNAIIGLTELLRESPLNADQQDMLRTIWASSESLFHLINDLLEVSRIEAGQVDLEMREFDLREACEQAMEIIYPRARQKGLLFYCVLPEWNAPTLVGDPHRLRQMILNLLNNAVKFTERGHVILRAEWDLSRPGFAAVTIAVEDTGVGIAPEQQQRVFEKFIRVDSPLARKVGGVGLGLNIARSLAGAMGGTIELESQPGVGSTFRLALMLPVASAESAQVKASEAPRPALLLATSKERAPVLSAVCRGAGLDVRLCHNAAEALARAEAEPQPDAVAIDSTFAFEAAEALRFQRLLSLAGRPPVVLLPADENEPLPAWTASLPVRKCALPLMPTRIRRALDWEVSRASAASAAAAGATAEAAPHRAGVILLVEDNPDTRAYVLRVLARNSHMVTVATTGAEAVAEAGRRAFDVILMDVMLPDMTGFEATRAIRELETRSGRARETIIALTAHALQGYRQQAFASDMDDYLTKPVRMQTLLATLDRWLGDSTPPAAASVTSGSENGAAVSEAVVVDPDIADMVPGYLDSAKKSLEECAAMAAAGDAAGVRRHAHNLEGSGESYGFAELTRLAREMGAAARAGDLGAAGKMARAALDYLRDVRWKALAE